MRKFAFAILTLLSFAAFGQQNILHTAAFWNQQPSIDKIKAQINQGNSPSAAGPYGADATVYAINSQSSLAVIQFMLAQPGNDINKKVSNGRRYINSAASKGNVPLMEYLIGKGAKTNLIDDFGYSVLTYAAATAQTDTNVYNVCIKHGAKPSKELIVGGANALMLLAPYDKDFSLISYFVNKGIDIKATDSTGSSAFDYALKGGNITVLKALAAKGASIKPEAMVTASMGNANNLSLFTYLEELKLNPKAMNNNGDNALHYIVNKPNPEVINYLIAKGVDVNHANKQGHTPLINAASNNADLATFNLLLPLVKNINAVNKNGESALAFAVRRNNTAVVKSLLENGATVNLIDREGYNMAYYLLSSFATKPADFDSKLTLLQQRGFDISTVQGNGNTLYHLALAGNGLNLLKRIAGFGVDVNAKNKEGLTPLHKAAMMAKDDQVLKYLISIGANKDLKTGFNETAFELAKENEYLNKQKISIDFLK